jgi:hypothetical protein
LDKQVDLLKDTFSVSGHALIEKALREYDFENADKSTNTFESITSYIEEQFKF